MSVFRFLNRTLCLMTKLSRPLLKTCRISGASLAVFGLGCYLLGRHHQQAFPPILFNLTEAERQQVWKGYFEAEMRAAMEANQAFPALSPLSAKESLIREHDHQRLELRNQLKEHYTQRVLDDHGLSFAQFCEIDVEGRLKRWTAPLEMA